MPSFALARSARAWLLAALLSITCRAGAAERDAVLHLYNWNNYIAQPTLARFEQLCACRVKQDYYTDNEEMLAKLEAGATGYDILVPTGNAVETLIKQQALRPLDHALVPRLRNVKPEFLDPPFDPGNRYSVPYAYSITLLGYNVEKLRALGLPHDSWALIFEPEQLARIRGRVSVLNSHRELMGAALRYLGHSAQDRNPAHWEAAKQLILRAKPYWATFSNSTYIKELAVGNIWVAHGYSNDMYRAAEDAKAAGRSFSIGWTTPREGAVLGIDSMVLHKGGRRPDLAHRFIDFMLDGRNAAELSNLIGAGNPNAAAMPHIRADIASNPDIFPPPRALAQRLDVLRDLPPRERRVLARIWTQIKVH
ncbi:MAG: spermidine/putrescine ABC transporter substrate-binding protein [Burkholderiales bacterium]|nr:spermidine/putrescine ABC transporter substrate-binding protein [Burkholderiales bacterium]